MHGSQIRCYLGERDLSADVYQLDVAPLAEVHDTTTFADAGWRTADPGLFAWEGSLTGFYDPAAAGYGRQLETALGSNTAGLGVLSLYEGDADAVGDAGVLGSEAVVAKRGQPVNVGDLVRLSATLRGNGRMGLFGKLLHPKSEDTVSTNGSSLDNSASSANGGRGNLHITAISGTWTIKIEHSANGSAWSTLIAFTQATAIGAQTVEVTGTVNRYLRATSTEDVAGSITFVCGFSRY
jgi:hypothetical protein